VTLAKPVLSGAPKPADSWFDEEDFQSHCERELIGVIPELL
jgi:hypothetical protein